MLALGAYRPDVYAQIAALADNLLRTAHPESTLVPSEREMIAAYVSTLNDCDYCATIHGAVAAVHICSAKAECMTASAAGERAEPEDKDIEAQAEAVVEAIISVREDVQVEETEASPKLKPLLKIAAEVCASGKNVTEEAIAKAKAQGATDMDIHDTVLIAALFSMFNRYVDGLTGPMPQDVQEMKRAAGQAIAQKGYAARREAMKTAPAS
jgi:AhpD family alkylhydroperoxidase